MPLSKEVFFTQVWSHHSDGTYSIYVSDLDGNYQSAGVPRNTCPHCRKTFTHKQHFVSADFDASHEDIYGYNYKHDCGAELLVIND